MILGKVEQQFSGQERTFNERSEIYFHRFSQSQLHRKLQLATLILSIEKKMSENKVGLNKIK